MPFYKRHHLTPFRPMNSRGVVGSAMVFLGAVAMALVSLSHSIAMAAAQNQTPIPFRAGVVLVPVDVRVVDAEGKPVTDLTAADFTIFEDGIQQDIEQFSTRPYKAPSAIPRTFARVRRPYVSYSRD
jgi:hypothetical protein